MADPILPPTPATVSLAIVQANDLAYGFAKHTDDGYWSPLYTDDPDYAWKRMLGWMAGGADIARFGLYAIPPSPWHGTAVDPPVVVPPVNPPAPGDWLLLEQQIAALRIDVGHLMDVIAALAAKPAPTVTAPVYEGTVQIPFFGSAKITLTPKA